MKNFGSVIPFFLFVLMSVSAQDGYKEGFVVLNNGDTLYGKIMDRKPEPFGGLLTKIRYQGEAGKKRFSSKRYRPINGVSIFLSGWLYYLPEAFLMKRIA